MKFSIYAMLEVAAGVLVALLAADFIKEKMKKGA